MQSYTSGTFVVPPASSGVTSIEVTVQGGNGGNIQAGYDFGRGAAFAVKCVATSSATLTDQRADGRAGRPVYGASAAERCL